MAEVEGSEVADGVGSVFAPAHAAPFEAIAHHGLAGALHRTAADLPAVRQITRVVHPMLVVLEVPQAVGMRLPCGRQVRREIDQFGNLVISLSADHIAKEITFTAWILAERDTTAGPILVTRQLYEGDLLHEFSRLTEPDDALRVAAAEIGPAASERDLADRICAWVYASMNYREGATDVSTTAVQAFARREGVCQDYAHIMLALCRLRGLAARYVSGHLLGEGGTHAWVEVLLPDPQQRNRFIAQPLDPTHDRVPGASYLTVATGRDYSDVAPTSGAYRGKHTGQLFTSKHAGVTAVEYFDRQ